MPLVTPAKYLCNRLFIEKNRRINAEVILQAAIIRFRAEGVQQPGGSAESEKPAVPCPYWRRSLPGKGFQCCPRVRGAGWFLAGKSRLQWRIPPFYTHRGKELLTKPTYLPPRH